MSDSIIYDKERNKISKETELSEKNETENFGLEEIKRCFLILSYGFFISVLFIVFERNLHKVIIFALMHAFFQMINYIYLFIINLIKNICRKILLVSLMICGFVLNLNKNKPL